jgi:hypothetical protein
VFGINLKGSQGVTVGLAGSVLLGLMLGTGAFSIPTLGALVAGLPIVGRLGSSTSSTPAPATSTSSAGPAR